MFRPRTVLLFTFIFLLLALIYFSYRYYCAPVSDVFIIKTTSPHFKKSNLNLVKFKFFNNQLLNLSNCYLTIYQDNETIPIYGFSIIKTNTKGETEFYLKPGNYLAIISSDEINTSDKYKYLLSYKFSVRSNSIFPNFSISFLPLSLTVLEPNPNLQKQINEYKVEAVYQSKVGPTSSTSVARNDSRSDQTTFYTSPGVYNFNIDILNFNSLPLGTSYALAIKNIDIQKYKKYHFYLPQDISELKKISLNVNDSQYFWIKTSPVQRYSPDSNTIFYYPFTGDFQSMVINNQLSISTNLSDSLEVSMAYQPSPKCMNYYLSINTKATNSLYFCSPTDIRYDYNLIGNHLNTSNNNLDPPNEISLINRNGNLQYYYQNSDSKKNLFSIFKIYIHELWDQVISPIVKITDQTTGKSVQYNFAAIDMVPFTSFLPNGHYLVEANLPDTIWTKHMLGNTQITVANSEIKNFQTVKDTNNYLFSSWQELYENRNKIFGANPSSYLQISIDKSKYSINPVLYSSQNISVNNCQDLISLSSNPQSNTTIIINIDSKYTNNTKDQQEFINCLSKFAQKSVNKKLQFALKNSFLDDPFVTQTTYIFYHYYQSIRSQSQIPIGIVVEGFQDFFHGIADFNLVSTDTFQGKDLIPKNKTKDVLEYWLLDYQDILGKNPPPNIYY